MRKDSCALVWLLNVPTARIVHTKLFLGIVLDKLVSLVGERSATLTSKDSEIRFERYSYVFIVAIQFRSFIGSLPDSQGLTSEVSVPETTFPGKDCFPYRFISVRVFWLWPGYWSSYFVGS